MMLTGVSHTGWKQIAARLGLKDVDTARRWAKKYHIPVVIFGRRAVLDEGLYVLWLSEVIKISEERENLREKLVCSRGDPKGSAVAVVES